VDRGGFKLLKRGGWQWQATRMTEPDRVERPWLVLAVATRYVLAVGGEADEAEFGDATIPEPSARPVPAATARRSAQSTPGHTRRRGTAQRETPVRVPKRRRTGTKQRLISVFRQGLAVLMSAMIAGHALPKPSWKPEAWLQIRCDIKTVPQQPPTPVPKNPSL
jgi:hypothetical protein